jgi:protein TonB
MLDQLVESKNNSAENTRRSEFLLVVFVLIVSGLLGGWTYSLFAKDYGMGAGDLDISSLVAPVALPEDAPPPPPEPDKQPEKTNTSSKMTVIEKVATIEQTTQPQKDLLGKKDVIGIKKSESKWVEEGSSNNFNRNNVRENENPPEGIKPGGGGGGGGEFDDVKVKKEEPKKEEPKKEEPTPKPPPKVVSGGVVNGKATSLVKPPYPPAARAVNASGAVNVQVTIDENGNVISASAVSGHPLLRAAAVQAARSSKFSPTKLSGQPVKVTGVIVYNFQP